MAVNSDRARPPRPALTVHSSGRSEGAGERHAQTPAPARWQDVALRVFHGFSEDRITTISGGVTFFVLLALFPGLAGLISLYVSIGVGLGPLIGIQEGPL